jgi:hypothetical protein
MELRFSLVPAGELGADDMMMVVELRQSEMVKVRRVLEFQIETDSRLWMLLEVATRPLSSSLLFDPVSMLLWICRQDACLCTF